MTTGRPRSFDKGVALETIMQVFWEKGYEGTTKRDLMDATGLASQSLYNAFGDKQAMFQMALDHYANTRLEELRQMLSAGETPLASLRGFVEMWADLPEEFRRGCLFCNTAAQVDPAVDVRISQFIRDKLTFMRQAFLECLQQAQAAGEVSESADIEAIASTLVSTANGVALLYRIGAPDDLIRDAARGTLQMIQVHEIRR